MSLPGEASLEEVLHHPPREAWPLARVLNGVSMKMGRTGLLAQPRHGPEAGKSADPRSQNADTITPDHHVVSQHDNCSNGAYLGTTLLSSNLVKGSSYNATVVLSKVRCIKR